MTGKVPHECHVGLVIYIKQITLESVNDHVFSLSNILDIATVAFQAINHITALACAMHYDIISLIAVHILNSPCVGDPTAIFAGV